MEAPAQGIWTAWTFYNAMPSSSRALQPSCDLISALPSPGASLRKAVAAVGCWIYSILSPGSPEAVAAAGLVLCSRAEPSAGKTSGGQPSATRHVRHTVALPSEDSIVSHHHPAASLRGGVYGQGSPRPL